MNEKKIIWCCSLTSLKILILLLMVSLIGCDGDRSTNLARITEESNILQLTEKMSQGELSSVELTRFFIDEINVKNDKLKAVIAINPKALEIAAVLDNERIAGNIRGPLHGIPILVKDNIETKDMATTAGSLALEKNHTDRDATLITNLKNSGAVILGKTNLSEWANFRSERSSSGWSAVGGQARNPHDMSRSPCGSSSGSGAAVAANLAVAAIGTETNGSIVCPSSANGVVGIKPTLGLVSRFGIVPISHTQDTAGPMTKNVTDAAILLSAMHGRDSNDPATQQNTLDFSKNYLPQSSQNYLKGKRVGIIFSDVLEHEGVLSVFKKTKTLLEKQGAILIDDLKIEPYEDFGKDSYDVLLYEFKHGLNQYFANLPNDHNQLTLKKLIEYNQENADREMPFFQQEIFEKAQAKANLDDPVYLSALTKGAALF